MVVHSVLVSCMRIEQSNVGVSFGWFLVSFGVCRCSSGYLTAESNLHFSELNATHYFWFVHVHFFFFSQQIANMMRKGTRDAKTETLVKTLAWFVTFFVLLIRAFTCGDYPSV